MNPNIMGRMQNRREAKTKGERSRDKDVIRHRLANSGFLTAIGKITNKTPM